MNLFDACGHCSHVGSSTPDQYTRAWLVTASAAEAKLIKRALKAPEIFTKSQFLDVSNGQQVITEGDIVLLKAPGVDDAALFLPERLRHLDLDGVIAAVGAARPCPPDSSRGLSADLMFVTFRGAPDLAVHDGPHRSRLELLLRHLRTKVVRANIPAVVRVCEDALALLEPTRALALSAALGRMRVSGLAIGAPGKSRVEVTKESTVAVRQLRASGRESAAQDLGRLVSRASSEVQFELFPIDDVERPRPSLGTIIRKCAAVALAVDIPAAPLPTALAPQDQTARFVANLALPMEKIVAWVKDCRADLLIPSVTISAMGERSRSMAVALTSELSFLLGAVPRTDGEGVGAEWTIIPHSPQRRFHPVASSIRAGCAATFTFDSGGRRISQLYLTLSRPNRPARTLRVPLSHQRYG